MAGRPTKRNEEIDRKIDEAAAIGASVEEIAFYAGIHRDTLYTWMKDDKELSDRIQELQERPIMKARQTVVKSLDNPADAQWYLERKRKKEFAPRKELTGEDGEAIQIKLVQYGNHDTTQLQSAPISVGVPKSTPEIQDSGATPESGQINDASQRADTQDTATQG